MLLLLQDIGVNEEAGADQTDLSASPPLPFAPPPPLHLSDITAHEPTPDGLADPVEDGEERGGGAAFEFEEEETAELRAEEEKPEDGWFEAEMI